MRTTVIIEDHLLREAKQLATRRGITLSELVNQALRGALVEPVPPATTFEMITYGGGAPTTHREPDELARALEDDDRSSLGR